MYSIIALYKPGDIQMTDSKTQGGFQGFNNPFYTQLRNTARPI